MESVSETQRTEWLGQALTVFNLGPMCDAAYQVSNTLDLEGGATNFYGII